MQDKLEATLLDKVIMITTITRTIIHDAVIVTHAQPMREFTRFIW